MRRKYLLVAAVIVALLPILGSVRGVGSPVSAALSSLGDASGSLQSDAASTSDASSQDCSLEPMPEVIHLGEEEILEEGLLYLVKGPAKAIAEVFPERTWEEPFGDTSHSVALVTPSQNTTWPAEGDAGASSPVAPSAPDARRIYNAWEIVQGWRTPLVMFSPQQDPLDVANLGVLNSDWVVLTQVLDHENQFRDDQDRHAWAYLVPQAGPEQLLGQLEIADPAFMSFTIPEPGEVQARTHDSTIWWAQCLPPPSIAVTKTADPNSLPEPGGLVEFTVRVDNTSPLALTLTSLDDDIHGDITTLPGVVNPSIDSTTCAVPQSLPVGGHYACSFTATVSGNAGDTETNTVTAVARDRYDRQIAASDSATVILTDVPSSIRVTKTADPTSVPEPGADVQFTVVVVNTSAVDNVTIQSIVDDRFGDIGDDCDRALPATLAPAGRMTCVFSQFIGGNPGDTHTNVVTASGVDDDGHPVSDHDSAVVIIVDVPSIIEVIKTADPYWMYYHEEGRDVTFAFTINNLSAVDSVTIDSLTDTIYGDLNGRGDCSVPQPLAVGGSYACSFTARVYGEPDSTHTNVVTASGVDDDGHPVSDDDLAVVTIAAEPSSIDLAYFVASGEDQQIVVAWETFKEQNNWGFNLYRGPTPSFEAAKRIHFEHALGSQLEGHAYQYEDTDVIPGQVYHYWLEDVDLARNKTQHGPVTAATLQRIYLPLVVNIP